MSPQDRAVEEPHVGTPSSTPPRAPARGALADTVWVFDDGRRDLARQLRLLPDGRISGYRHFNEAGWTVARDAAVFLDGRGRPTCRFDRIERDAGGETVAMAGAVIAEPAITHRLRRTAPVQVLAPNASGFAIDERPGWRCDTDRRRNLVLLFADHRSLHHRWERDVAEADRSWDLCVSFYGPADRYANCRDAEMTSLQTGIGKCRAAHAAFGVGSRLWGYERVWFADDDLVTRWSDIEALFAIFEHERLLLAQPSLSPDSHVAHPITRRRDDMRLRYTSFVEAMTPIFTKESLALCIPVFQNQRYGWGIDHVWPKLLGPSRSAIAVIDEVSVVHTRPIGLDYDRGAAGEEERRLLDAWGVAQEIREYGGLAR